MQPTIALEDQNSSKNELNSVKTPTCNLKACPKFRAAFSLDPKVSAGKLKEEELPL